MSATTNTSEAELLWVVITSKGARFYRWGCAARRVLPVARAEAERLIASGAARVGTRPGWL